MDGNKCESLAIYACAKTETLIQSLCETANCSEDVVTQRVADLLRSKGTWVIDQVPDLSARTTERSATVAKVAMDVRTHRKARTLSMKARKAIAKAQRARWAKYKAAKQKKVVHWTQTPKGRAFMRKTAANRFGKKAA